MSHVVLALGIMGLLACGQRANPIESESAPVEVDLNPPPRLPMAMQFTFCGHYGTTESLVLGRAQGGTEPLRYSIEPLYSWMTFDSDTRRLTMNFKDLQPILLMVYQVVTDGLGRTDRRQVFLSWYPKVSDAPPPAGKLISSNEPLTWEYVKENKPEAHSFWTSR